ncbi:ribonuclease Z [Alicyclobacillus sp.]|uniref:ribonuclease Z n=1 Tax=Alicyclobacillus sp. TaxID=61169 RepID=UPI0025C67129|nr:ribonuclease Z [Alicyclobacillus sp.]MCL6515694.1 ribonuclease Z [Alicyclobacillus sp.]
MELVFLGTGAGVPTTARNVTAIALTLWPERPEAWLFDCGEATQHRLQQARTSGGARVRARQLRRIFLTHLHGDHLFGLPGLLGSRSFQGAVDPVTVYGPEGIRRYLEWTLEVSRTHLTYPLEIIEIRNAGVIHRDDRYEVRADWLDHTLPSLGYRVVERDRPGRLRTDRLRALGIPPGPLYGALKRGRPVPRPGGGMVHPRDVLDPPTPGRVLTVLGDTRPCAGAASLARGADVLVHEATFGSDRADLAPAFGHSTAADAARTARDAGARALILTHISARYDKDGAQRLLEEARAVFPDTVMAFDLWSYPIPASPAARAT